MEQPPGELQARLECLTRQLSDVERRLATLESRWDDRDARDPLPAPAGAAAPHAAASPPDQPGGPLASTLVVLLGRSLVVLGGGYLLRALTEAGMMPRRVGPFVGLLYAAWWLGQADRAAGRGRGTEAVFHGVASALIAYPLLVEATLRLRAMEGPVAAAVLVAFACLGLTVACRGASAVLAWTATLAAVGTALVLFVATRDLAPFAAALLLLAAAVEILAARDCWPALRWPAAVGADFGLGATLILVLRPAGLPEGYAPVPSAWVVAIALALPLVSLTGTAARTLRRGRLVSPFEVLQSTAALALGLGGAAAVLSSAGRSLAGPGLLAVALGAAGYAAAFAWVERRDGARWNFYAYTTWAGLLVLAGSRWLFHGAALAAIWSALGIGAAWLGRRFARASLSLHGALYAASAAGAGGLLAAAYRGLVDGSPAWRTPALAGLLPALAAMAGAYALLTVRVPQPFLERQRVPRSILAALLAWTAAGLAAGRLEGALGGGNGPGDPGLLAAVRMATLALLAVAAGWAGRRFRLVELSWLVYPALVAGGLELLLVARGGGPFTLFASLAAYGLVLIAVPRLVRRA
jgi:hypothetical protein